MVSQLQKSKRNLLVGFILGILPYSIVIAQTGKWSLVTQNALTGCQECAFAQAGGKFYLMGGDGMPPVQEFTTSTHTWKKLKAAPVVLNHFQALTYAGLIYAVSSFNDSNKTFPKELPTPNVYIYDPLSDSWIKGMTIPKERQRGSAGVVEYNDKFYSVLGNKMGHTAAGVTYLDEFNPTTNEWKALPDAPRTRDHFQAAIMNGKIYATGGRQSASPATPIFTNLEKMDVYDIAAGTWSTLASPQADLPHPRSGLIVATIGNEIIYAGGGNPNDGTKSAYTETDAFNVLTQTWRTLAPLNTGRQVTGGFINNTGFYIASGSPNSNGGGGLLTTEVFFMADSLPPTGEALIAGQLKSTEASFNFGIVPSGQSKSRTLYLSHFAGNQGVLIAGLKVVGDAGYQVKSVVSAPYIVKPGAQSAVEMTFTSNGNIPADSYLEVTLAIPPGVVVKAPLEANKNVLSIQNAAHSAKSQSLNRYWNNGWYFRLPHSESIDGQQNISNDFRDAQGQILEEWR